MIYAFIKRKILPCAFLLAIILFCTQSFRSKEYKYQLALTGIFQNEDRFLKEWIDFHRAVGVEHFYLFNNLSTDNYLAVLTPYIEAGIVELQDWPYKSKAGDEGDWVRIQSNAYSNAIQRANGEAKWLAILDTDEFLFPVKKDNLIDFLKDYENYPGLLIHWQMFGTSNVQRIASDEFLIERLTLQAPVEETDHRFCKSIVRPECVKTCVSAHSVTYYPWAYPSDVDGYIFPWKFYKYHPVKIDKIRINHYWTRDEDFFFERKLSRNQNWGDADKRKNSCLLKKEGFNQIFNSEILKFLPRLKEKHKEF